MYNRIIYIDLLKLFAIFLVLWGHTIMHFQTDYENSICLQTIHSFHMPLFMMLSGYFAKSSMTLSLKEFIPKKFRQLLLPCISWAIVCWLLISSGLINGKFHLNIHSLFHGWLGMVDNFWFLKSCFVCYSISWICFRFGKYKTLAFIIACIGCSQLVRFNLNMMFPCFIFGMFLRNNNRIENASNSILIACIVSFLVMLAYRIIGHCDIYVYRLILGLLGAYCCFMVFKKAFAHTTSSRFTTVLAKMGGATLAIYVLQAIILEYIMPQYISFSSLPLYIISMLMPIIAFGMLLIFYTIYCMICASQNLSLLLFGK